MPILCHLLFLLFDCCHWIKHIEGTALELPFISITKLHLFFYNRFDCYKVFINNKKDSPNIAICVPSGKGSTIELPLTWCLPGKDNIKYKSPLSL